MNYRDDIAQFTLERRVEICAALDSSQAVAVCQFCEDADIAVVFKLNTYNYIFFDSVGQIQITRRLEGYKRVAIYFRVGVGGCYN